MWQNRNTIYTNYVKINSVLAPNRRGFWQQFGVRAVWPGCIYCWLLQFIFWYWYP